MADSRDITVDRRSRFVMVVSVKVDWLADLSGYSAVMQIRKMRSDAAALDVWTSFLTVQVAQSTVTLDLPADHTALATWDTGYYDIYLTDGSPGHDVRVLQGKVTLDKEVTR